MNITTRLCSARRSRVIATRRPRVLYVNYGETDEWGHARRYDRYLEAAQRVDRWMRELWETMQSLPRISWDDNAHRDHRSWPRRAARGLDEPWRKCAALRRMVVRRPRPGYPAAGCAAKLRARHASANCFDDRWASRRRLPSRSSRSCETPRSTYSPSIHESAQFLLALLIACTLHAADWPEFMGPTRDQVSTETG